MNKAFLLIFMFSLFYLSAQKSQTKIYLYKSSEDYKKKQGEFVGYLEHSWFSIGSFYLKLKNEKDEVIRKRIDKDYWGFKLGDLNFRVYESKRPLLILRVNSKVFYKDGVSMLLEMSNKKVDTKYADLMRPNLSNMFFYSDGLESEVFKLLKALKRKKKNNLPEDLAKCLKVAYKHSMSQMSDYDEITDCINSF